MSHNYRLSLDGSDTPRSTVCLNRQETDDNCETFRRCNVAPVTIRSVAMFLRRRSILGAFVLSISMKRVSMFSRVPYDDMFPIFTALELALVNGVIEVREYTAEWSELLELTGWSDEAIADEVDRRWTTMTTTKESFVC